MEREIRKILIANRGEIACRIIKTCKSLGIQSAVVFSNPDENALFVELADEAYRIGGAQPGESYLVQDKIIEAAKALEADAIHPGYGFLSENATFAQRCADEDIVFIGPNAAAIEAMGSKIKAKAIMSKAGVPVIPGYNGDDQSDDNLISEAKKVGFPLLLKASAGGGGKGMRVVREEKNLKKSLEAAKREALNAFGDDKLLIEKYFDHSRHIEMQIFGDKHHNYIHLGERECSIQRRHQKVIEESPSPILSADKRAAMGEAAVKAAEAINYDNAGTVEFIYTEKDEFYFLEVNTRLQVEHPVTEMVTGHDLVEWQIKVAEGKPLPARQNEIQFNGHAIEARLYAEDPNNDYLPVTGKLLLWETPDDLDVRIDTGVTSNSMIDVFYDPMIAKVIAYGTDRHLANKKLQAALRQLNVSGLTTNKNFLLAVLANEDFKSGNFDTGFLANSFEIQEEDALKNQNEFSVAVLCYEYALRKQDRNTLQELPSGWRSNFYEPQQVNYTIGDNDIKLRYTVKGNKIAIQIDEEEYLAKHIKVIGHTLSVEINGVKRKYSIANQENDFHLHQNTLGNAVVSRIPRFTDPGSQLEKGGYAAPMPGQVIEVKVQSGDTVKKGDTLIILLSMKMENAIEAAEDGLVEEVFVEKDAFVEADKLLLKIKTE